jgi:hypothetical protein
VQDAINTLCGKGDSAYNDNYPNCEQDSGGEPIGFLDSSRRETLLSMISAAESISPPGWRSLALSEHPDKESITEKISSLGLQLTCDGGTTSSSQARNHQHSSMHPHQRHRLTVSTESLFADPEKTSTSVQCTAGNPADHREHTKTDKAKARELGKARA